MAAAWLEALIACSAAVFFRSSQWRSAVFLGMAFALAVVFGLLARSGKRAGEGRSRVLLGEAALLWAFPLIVLGVSALSAALAGSLLKLEWGVMCAAAMAASSAILSSLLFRGQPSSPFEIAEEPEDVLPFGEEEPKRDPDFAENHEPVEVDMVYATDSDARLALAESMLMSAGIEFFTAGSYLDNAPYPMAPARQNSVGRLQLHVRREDAEDARVILDTLAAEE